MLFGHEGTSVQQKATASEEHNCISAGPAGDSGPAQCCFNPTMKGLSGLVRRGDLQVDYRLLLLLSVASQVCDS